MDRINRAISEILLKQELSVPFTYRQMGIKYRVAKSTLRHFIMKYSRKQPNLNNFFIGIFNIVCQPAKPTYCNSWMILRSCLQEITYSTNFLPTRNNVKKKWLKVLELAMRHAMMNIWKNKKWKIYKRSSTKNIYKDMKNIKWNSKFWRT